MWDAVLAERGLFNIRYPEWKLFWGFETNSANFLICRKSETQLLANFYNALVDSILNLYRPLICYSPLFCLQFRCFWQMISDAILWIDFFELHLYTFDMRWVESRCIGWKNIWGASISKCSKSWRGGWNRHLVLPNISNFDRTPSLCVWTFPGLLKGRLTANKCNQM